MEDKELNPQESLHLIESMLNTVKSRFSEDGFLYLLWGWVVFSCSLIQFILIHFYKYPHHYYVWFITWIVVIFQFIYMRKRNKKRKVKTYTDEIIRYVWIAFLIMCFLYSYLIGSISGDDYYKNITPIMLASYGMPVFLSGIILRFRPLIIGGIGCWVLSVISLFMVYEYRFLMGSLAMLIAWIIPGYLLRAKYMQQKNEQ